MAISIVQSQLQHTVNASDIHFQSGFSEGPDTYLYEGVLFANAVANVALHNNKIVAFGSSFVQILAAKIISSLPYRDVPSVIPLAEEVLNGKFDGHATLEYLVEGEFARRTRATHVVQIQNDNKGTRFEAAPNAYSGGDLWRLTGAYDGMTMDRTLPCLDQAAVADST
ncbi:hypothetical protein BD779DRAFT_1800873 [Infundibulicybe gibba]|nr:hypothetical protein BD779DRAFT_1800873 [Infundibulicybe gibba]